MHARLQGEHRVLEHVIALEQQVLVGGAIAVDDPGGGRVDHVDGIGQGLEQRRMQVVHDGSECRW